MITIGMLLYMLSLDTTIHTNIDPKRDYELKGFERWSDGFPQKKLLYLLDKEELIVNPDIWYGKIVIFAGKLDEAFLTEKNISWISVTDHFSIQEIEKEVLSIFRQCYEWYSRLQHTLLIKQPITEILNLTEELLQIGGCVATREMNLKGVSKVFAERCDWIEADGGVSMSLVNDLIADEDFQKAVEEKDAFFFCSNEQEWYCCYNFQGENDYDARLIMNTRKRTIEHGLKSFVSLIGNALGIVYEQYYYAKSFGPDWQEMISTARQMFEGKAVKYGDLSDVLGKHQWEVDDCYQVILFRFQKGAGAGVGMRYYEEQILRLFRECFVIAENTQFVCVRNMTRSEDADTYKKALPYFLRETLCKAGISNVFNDYSQLLYYYREADYALTNGERNDGSRWYHSFSDSVYDYVIEQTIQEMMPQQVCHPAIKMLAHYDEKNDTALMKTLDIYLQNRQNITKTASDLDIHRSTLLARIDRIQTLTKVDLDDHKTCLHIMISYEILKRDSRKYASLL